MHGRPRRAVIGARAPASRLRGARPTLQKRVGLDRDSKTKMAAGDSVTGSSTAEYRTVRRLVRDLQLAFQNDLTRVSSLLQGTTPMLLMADNAAEVQNSIYPAADQTAKLVEYIQVKVESDPKCYHALVKVLERTDSRYYSNILQRLNTTFQEEGGRVEPNGCPSRAQPPKNVVEVGGSPVFRGGRA